VIVAIPATEPHRPIAVPRLSGGKTRVMSAMVCGVMSAPPTPWTARATISHPMVGDSPHANDDSVKVTRPATYTGLGPTRSPSRPVTSSSTAKVSR
jgi:hypothetical protein